MLRQTKTVPVIGYCHFLCENTTIYVEYQRIMRSSRLGDYAKAVSFSCNEQQCPNKNACPIFEVASQDHDW